MLTLRYKVAEMRAKTLQFLQNTGKVQGDGNRPAHHTGNSPKNSSADALPAVC